MSQRIEIASLYNLWYPAQTTSSALHAAFAFRRYVTSLSPHRRAAHAQPSSSAAALRAFALMLSTCSSRFRICARASRSSAVKRAFSSLSAESYIIQRESTFNSQ